MEIECTETSASGRTPVRRATIIQPSTIDRQPSIMNKLRVAVLMGGTSAERAISLSTGRQIVAALDPKKYIPMALDAAALSGKTPELPPGVPILALPTAAADDARGAELVPLGLSQIADPA